MKARMMRLFFLGGALLSFYLSAILFPPYPVPLKEDLLSASGVVQYMERGDYSADFRLSGYDAVFVCLSKSHNLDEIEEALQINGSFIEVLHENEDDPQSLTVWQVTADGEMIQSYEATKENWEKDDLIGQWLAGFLLLIGLYFGFCWFKSRPHDPPDGSAQ